jgi:hypothetical protein
VGAKTVNGPSPERVSTKPAALTAATRVLKLLAPTATSTMVFSLVGVSAFAEGDNIDAEITKVIARVKKLRISDS